MFFYECKTLWFVRSDWHGPVWLWFALTFCFFGVVSWDFEAFLISSWNVDFRRVFLAQSPLAIPNGSVLRWQWPSEANIKRGNIIMIGSITIVSEWYHQSQLANPKDFDCFESALGKIFITLWDYFSHQTGVVSIPQEPLRPENSPEINVSGPDKKPL